MLKNDAENQTISEPNPPGCVQQELLENWQGGNKEELGDQISAIPLEVPGQQERAVAEKTEPRVHQDLGWGTKAGIGIKGRDDNGDVHRGEWALQSDLTAPSQTGCKSLFKE